MMADTEEVFEARHLRLRDTFSAMGLLRRKMPRDVRAIQITRSQERLLLGHPDMTPQERRRCHKQGWSLNGIPVIVSLWVLLLSGFAWAQENGTTLVAVPSFTGELPDGTPVIGLVIVPAENVLNRSAAWQTFEAQWPTRYRVQAPTPVPPTE